MRQKEYKPLPEKYLWQLALHTGQWCRAVLCQAHRFFDALEADNRPLPWDDSESFDMFLADKTFSKKIWRRFKRNPKKYLKDISDEIAVLILTVCVER